MIVLDTNVLSEAMRPSPDAEVLRWMAGQPASQLFTTTITQAEILYGLELMPKGKRHASLKSAIEAMFEEDFGDRILPFDSDAALWFAQIAASRRKVGRPVSQWDAQIAAIARSRGAALATRNTDDFEHCGITLINPWSA
ncbi:MAG: type II toxin-antitoxin system VapC family toxin [Acidobacteriia bacterium]|nr:type II toxin-antitoxin system VapC family toxin [Terriglobia bacterium]